MSIGKNVGNVADLDDRLIQKYYIEKLNKKKDIVVLGSSRALMIKKDFFPNKIFFNSSVSLATLEDYLAIYNIYRKHNMLPKTIILGLDPFLLNKNNRLHCYNSLDDDYMVMLKLLGFEQKNIKKKIIPDKYFQLVSLSYFQASIKESNKDDYFATDAQKTDYLMKFSDGSRSYDLSTRSKNIYQVKQMARDYANGEEVRGLAEFKELDPELAKLLERFTAFVISDNVELVFLMTPYHDSAYQILINREDTKIIVEAQKYFISIAEKHGVKTIGSFNPLDCGLTDNDFYDQVHINNNGTKKIFTNNNL